MSHPPAGDLQVHGIGFDLDEAQPVARSIETPSPAGTGDVVFGSPVFEHHQYTLSKGEVLVFNVIARTRRHFVEWCLELDLLVQGRPLTVAVDQHGQPFRTSADHNDFAKKWNMAWYEPGFERFVSID